MKVATRDYNGKKVFVGMDVHKKRYVIAAYCDGEILKKWSTPAGHESIVEQLKRFFSGAEIFSAYEAGFSGFKLHRVLRAAGIHNIVIHAASVESKSNDRVKTDKRDAKKITEQLATGRLKGIYVPTEDEERRRSLSRGREQAVERRKTVGNQLKMKLHYLGIEIPNEKKTSEGLLRWIETIQLDPEHRFAINELIDAWRQESKRIKRFDTELEHQAANDPLEKVYRSAPGIGAVSARTLSNEFGDMSRFGNERQLFAASGLTPSEHSTGDHIRRGHISRQGVPRIRGLLVEAAWRAIAEDSSLRNCYTRVASRRGGKRAIVAVARKMLGRLRYCLKNCAQWKECVEAKAAS